MWSHVVIGDPAEEEEEDDDDDDGEVCARLSIRWVAAIVGKVSLRAFLPGKEIYRLARLA